MQARHRVRHRSLWLFVALVGLPCIGIVVVRTLMAPRAAAAQGEDEALDGGGR
jgi:hypothetical protein